jgi:hypothetical protein
VLGNEKARNRRILYWRVGKGKGRKFRRIGKNRKELSGSKKSGNKRRKEVVSRERKNEER